MPEPTEHGWQVEARALAASKLEIAVHDVIGKSFWDEGGVTSKDFLASLRSVPDAKEIDLRVNSIGGIVDEAKGMRNLLLERAAAGVKVTGYVDGIAASAASYLLTAAERVVMPDNAFQMLHEAYGGVRGRARDIAGHAELMARINDQLASAYAEASQRRGKDKTKEDFLALLAQGDTYFDADEAIEWGLADEKIGGLKVAACLVDLAERAEAAPERLRGAPYVVGAVRADTSEPSAPVKAQLDLPGLSARAQQNPGTGKDNNMKLILAALGLSEDADEASIVAAINKNKTSARVGVEVEKLVGAIGDQAIGAVRALKDGQADQADLAAGLEKVTIALARKDFEAGIETARANGQIAPHGVKQYSEEFEAAAAKGASAAQAVVDDLRGYIAKAPKNKALARVPSTTARQVDGQEGPLKHNGKTFAQLKNIERSRLSQSDPELYALMRDEWVAAGKPAA